MGRFFPPEVLDDIRARLNVSDIVGRKVQLKRRGREYVGLSPFNKEKTPSFTVNDAKGFYHCFSSGKHGDVFTFLMDTEGLEFEEAVARLADETGVRLPEKSAPTPELEAQRAFADIYYDIHVRACDFFQKRLFSDAGREALHTLEARGFSRTVIETFGLGYASGDRGELLTFLLKHFKREDVLNSGLIIHGADIETPYDRFRDRIMFPISDVKGRIIAFGGRAMRADAPAKYLNSPETDLFHKGRTLYNLARAREAAFQSGRMLVVEGYADVIMLSQFGFIDSVAPLGTALTADQLGLMWRVVDAPVLAFDGDKAGQKAAFRALDIALGLLVPGKSVKVVFLPDGLDPDDFLRSRGKQAFEQLLGQAQSLFDVLMMRESAGLDLHNPDGRAALEASLYKAVGQIGHDGVKRAYLDQVRQSVRGVLRQSFHSPASNQSPTLARRDSAFRTSERSYRHGTHPSFSDPRFGKLKPSNELMRTALMKRGAGTNRLSEASVLMALLQHPRLLFLFEDLLMDVTFHDPDLAQIKAIMLDVFASYHANAEPEDAHNADNADFNTDRYISPQLFLDDVRSHLEEAHAPLQQELKRLSDPSGGHAHVSWLAAETPPEVIEQAVGSTLSLLKTQQILKTERTHLAGQQIEHVDQQLEEISALLDETRASLHGGTLTQAPSRKP